jgi:hypothetical protein
MIAKPSQTEAAKRLNPLEIITLILSIYVLIALLILSLVPLPPDAVALLDWMELAQHESAHEGVLREISLDAKISSLEAKLDELKILR